MTATDSSDLIAESQRIKDQLLEVENEVTRLAKAARQNLMSDTRKKLGYTEVAPVNSKALVDTRIAAKILVISPAALATVAEVSEDSMAVTEQSRRAILNILDKQDDRLIVVVGPCSIHDAGAALEYAGQVKQWREKYGHDLEIVMRAYMEKPRTEKGWKGLVYDPLLDESEDINLGVVLMRLITCQITAMGVPIAMERLNALTPQYLNSLVAYDTIGARNTLDQKSREYASGTSSPVGFKNTPEGSIVAAIQAIKAARAPHAFLGMSTDGTISQINTNGNTSAHVILRGDNTGPNYSAEHIAKVKQLLKEHDLPESIVIDASHGNSQKLAANQLKVIADVAQQVASGETAIAGVMIESNLVEGAQNLKNANGSLKLASELVYGQSITDACVGLDDTAAMLANLADAVQTRRKV